MCQSSASVLTLRSFLIVIGVRIGSEARSGPGTGRSAPVYYVSILFGQRMGQIARFFLKGAHMTIWSPLTPAATYDHFQIR